MSLLHPLLIYYNMVIFLLMGYYQASSFLHLEASLKTLLGGAVVIPWDTKAGKLPSHSTFLARRYLLPPASHMFRSATRSAPSRNVSQEANARTFLTFLLLTVPHQKCPKYPSLQQNVVSSKEGRTTPQRGQILPEMSEKEKQSLEDTFHIFLHTLFVVWGFTWFGARY